MNVESVVTHLLQIPCASRGKTASPHHKHYADALGLNFIECLCAAANPNWDYPEFIAKTPRGAYVFIGCDSRKKIVSIGRKGYHSSQYFGGTCPALD